MIKTRSYWSCFGRLFVLIVGGIAVLAGPVPQAGAGSADLANAFARLKGTLAPTGYSMATSSTTFLPVAFADLPGWERDDHLAAWKAFITSCSKIAKTGGKGGTQLARTALVSVCEIALATNKATKQTGAGAKAFFETYFRPHSVEHTGNEGLLTGYYEPLIAGSRVRTGAFQTPVYRRPPDLVNMVAETERGAKSSRFTHMRRTKGGLKPYLTRAEIEQGGLTGQDLELIYFRDPVDVFFMQIQGSGRVALPDGSKVRIGYDGKNGYPYTSIGRVLIDDGEINARKMSLQAVKSWLRADRARGEKAMWQNKSYVFFRELDEEGGDGPVGALGVALKAGRSLAVDTAFHTLGMPIYVSSPTLKHAAAAGKRRKGGLARLMIAQDVGSAIKGPERGDIFFGSGDKAGRIAGVTKNAGRFFVFLPQVDVPGQIVARQR